jgi:nucleoside-diphosphate-sugar epimerase
VKIIRIFGCTGGKGERETRFPVMLDKALINGTSIHISQDKYFDYIHMDNLIQLIKDVIHSDSNEIINAVDPGPSLKLSEIAKLKGVKYTIGTDVLGSNYTAA